jgi:NADH:ubiquinone oxidoreductase subunit 5 (subunit L)/multisubunit Na+/H+ antiporter MnhA subunit
MDTVRVTSCYFDIRVLYSPFFTYASILSLPLLNSILCGIFGRFLGNNGSSNLSIPMSVSTTLSALSIPYEIIFCQSLVYIPLYNRILIEIYSLNFGLLFDPLSTFMVSTICSISSMVHVYSVSHTSHDPYISRSMCYSPLSTFSTLVSVTSNNFINSFFG